ncbi:MAG: Gfo/Idh/MocA family protein [Longimicrobiales bacterium]
MRRTADHDAVAIGVVGAGRIAERVHFNILSRLGGVRVVAVAEPSAARAAVIAKHFPSADSVPDARMLLARFAIDALVVCSPPVSHAETARMALEAGIHVYVEKPVAVTSEAARELVALAQASGCVAMAGFNYRRHPLLERLRLEVRSGRIGQPILMRSAFAAAHSSAAEWQASPVTGGGALLELGSHHFDLARFLFDAEAVDVSARVWARHQEGDTATVEFRLASGVSGQSVFAIGATDEDRIDILGESGIARFDRMRGDLSFEAQRFAYGRRHALAREFQTVGRSLHRVSKPLGEPSYQRSLAAFVDAVRTRKPARPDLRDGLRSLEWIEAAVRSATTGMRAEVSTIDAPAGRDA